MSYAKAHGAQTHLLNAYIVDIEVDLSRGLHAFNIIGLPDQATEEARDRISAAIKNSGFDSPKSSNHKITISLAPAEIKKEGAVLDLGMAVAYLLATSEIVFDPVDKIFLGELSLDGKLRKTKGVLALTREAKRAGFKEIFVPQENATEAALVEGISVYGAKSLEECLAHLEAKTPEKKIKKQPKTNINSYEKGSGAEDETDFSYIKGQGSAKRALEIAAAGGHNIALYGPPGTGKTMLARAFSAILPQPSFEEILEITEIHSIAGTLSAAIITERPFRSPHHTSSYVSIVGGGSNVRPGEITLAHKGVLFLDEFPEFDPKTIEALRQPLEEKYISVSRAKGTAKFPANFILIAAMNPCPCGNFGIKGKPCTCTTSQIARYKKRLSGPITDRIDLWVEVSRVEHEALSEKPKKLENGEIRERIMKARTKQNERFKNLNNKISVNGEMSARDLVTLININEEVKKILNDSARLLNISARSYHKLMKIARTIADLDNSTEISKNHILEAISYRPKIQY